MGKQYNFYISPREAKEFIEYIYTNGYIVVAPKIQEVNGKKTFHWLYSNLKKYTELQDFLEVYEYFYQVYLYKEEWGDILKSSKDSLDDRSPLIEYRRCSINEEHKALYSGRLYLSTYCKDEMKNFDIVNREYQKLVRTVKKYIIYKDYEYGDGKKCFWSASQEAIEILNNGYHGR